MSALEIRTPMIPTRFQPLFEFPDFEGRLGDLLRWLDDKTDGELDIIRWEGEGGYCPLQEK
jgi:hypothetical protein